MLANTDERALLVKRQDDRLILVKCENGKFVSHAEGPAHLGEVREWQLDNRRGSVVRAGSALHAARVLRCSLHRRLASLHRGASTCIRDKATHVKDTSKNKLRGAARTRRSCSLLRANDLKISVGPVSGCPLQH